MTEAAALRALLDGRHADVRDKVREWLSRPGTEPAAAELERAA